MSECTCIVECSHCVEIARLTRELDEARAEVERLRAALAGEGEVDPLHPNGRCTCAAGAKATQKARQA